MGQLGILKGVLFASVGILYWVLLSVGINSTGVDVSGYVGTLILVWITAVLIGCKVIDYVIDLFETECECIEKGEG